jgi:hypothetical protein
MLPSLRLSVHPEGRTSSPNAPNIFSPESEIPTVQRDGNELDLGKLAQQLESLVMSDSAIFLTSPLHSLPELLN